MGDREDHVIRGDRPTAVQSKIGFLLPGPFTSTSSPTTTDYIMNVISTPPSSEDIERFWKLESFGIQHLKEGQVLSYLKSYKTNCINFNDGRYTASLSWKPDHPELPDNYNITLRRTQNTICRLREEPAMLQKYDDIMKDQEKRGFIKKVNHLPCNKGPIHYIPHHGVKRQSVMTPIRIVFNCSCRRNKTLPSLNDCLESTPPEINDLSSILMNFRRHKFAVCADIEKAFLQVQLEERDYDMTRFLWLTNINDPNSDLTTYRFKSVLFGATFSPFILNATMSKHLSENKHMWVSEVLEKDLYIDNVISSFEDECTVIDYFRDA